MTLSKKDLLQAARTLEKNITGHRCEEFDYRADEEHSVNNLLKDTEDFIQAVWDYVLPDEDDYEF